MIDVLSTPKCDSVFLRTDRYDYLFVCLFVRVVIRVRVCVCAFVCACRCLYVCLFVCACVQSVACVDFDGICGIVGVWVCSVVLRYAYLHTPVRP